MLLLKTQNAQCTKRSMLNTSKARAEKDPVRQASDGKLIYLAVLV